MVLLAFAAGGSSSERRKPSIACVVITDTEPDRLAPLTPPAPIGLRGVWVVAARCCASPAARCCADAVERSFACPSSELRCRVHGGTIQTRDSYCGSPLAAAPA